MSDNIATLFDKYTKPHRNKLVHLLQEEKRLLNLRNPESPEYVTNAFRLADIQLHVLSLNLAQYYYSTRILHKSNLQLYSQARAACFQAIVYYEDVLTRDINPAFTDLKRAQAKALVFSDKQRYYYARRLGFCIDLLQKTYRERDIQGSHFIEFQLHHAVITRNLLDLTLASEGFDPIRDGFKERILHFELTQKVFSSAAESYRRKYESRSRDIKDFQIAINCLDAHIGLLRLCGMQEEEYKLKRKRAVWSTKLQSDI